MLNDITLMGRLVRDPELRKTSTGKSVTSFTLAVERDFQNNGAKETDFIDIVAWNNTADFVAKYFTKGRMAVVRGRLQTRTWTDNDGNNRKATEVIAESVYFGDSKPAATAAEERATLSKDADQASASVTAAAGSATQATAAAPDDDYPVLEDDDPDLPF